MFNFANKQTVACDAFARCCAREIAGGVQQASGGVVILSPVHNGVVLVNSEGNQLCQQAD